MEEYTHDGIPVISKDTYESLAAFLQNESRREAFMDEIDRRLKEENPLLLKALDDVLNYYGEGDFSDGVAFGIIFSYELARRQLESNRLKEISGLE